MGMAPVLDCPEVDRLAEERVRSLVPSTLLGAGSREVPSRLSRFRFLVGREADVRLATCRASGRIAYMFDSQRDRFPWVDPAFRGQGVATEALRISWQQGGMAAVPDSFTPQGFRLWAAAHRVLVQDAPPGSPALRGYEQDDQGHIHRPLPLVDDWNRAALTRMLGEPGTAKEAEMRRRISGMIDDPRSGPLEKAVWKSLVREIDRLRPQEDAAPGFG